ncbi:hypothetical protein AMS68_001714 [Peltaster fructicola]|uniref:ribonuclease Z n=1 Tax=Peltaster fructicola TaxID=286661 RepID=A0A6H0XN69_9PEZI|nr:hypothetical protein AMS68_001714 [Peltaster fructicola]
MKSSIQFITTPTADTFGTSLILHFDNKRYLIGSFAEGVQRACGQTGTRLLKVNECFITGRSEWSNTGGLIGMVLTVADATRSSRESSADEIRKQALAKAKRLGTDKDEAEAKLQQALDANPPQLTFFAPPNLNYQMATARRFVFRSGMPVNIHEILSSRQSGNEQTLEKPYWSDQNMQVWPMSILPSDASKPSNPRKRSFEMVDQDHDEPQQEKAEQERRTAMVKSVVNDMFNSTWKLDKLYETRLAAVQMPATIFIRNEETNKIDKYNGPMPGKDPLPNPDLQVLVRKPWPSATVSDLPPATPAKEAVSYIFRNHTIRGKFDVAKAKALKVPSGPLFSKLSNGESVQNTDGETIKPEQVLGPSKPGCCYGVIDLPDATYIADLVSRPEWKNGVAADIALIIWSCGRGVATDKRLKAFVAGLPKTMHIIASPEHCANYLTFDSSAATTIRFQQIDNDRYHVPVHNVKSEEDVSSNFPEGVTIAQRGQKINLDPAIAIHTEDIIEPLDVQQVIDGLPRTVQQEAQKARAALDSAKEVIDDWSKDLPGKDAEIITLGTGSALPSKYRNVSSTLLRVPGWGSMLFDCGEGTLGQLKRAFNPDELKQLLQDLRIIVISHMHADHHLGTTSVIRAWYEEVHSAKPSEAGRPEEIRDNLQGSKTTLSIVAEPAMHAWLHEYATMEDYGYSRIAPLVLWAQKGTSDDKMIESSLSLFIPRTLYVNGIAKQEAAPDHSISPAFLGLADIQAVFVNHCAGARAVSLTWPDGFKASYSGDCRPSKAFSRIGYGSTVCIHEATFDDELQNDARAKHHCTTSEALKVAQDMRARTCVLTHFSQRYQKLPILENDADGDSQMGTKIDAIQPEEAMDDSEDAPLVEAEVNGHEDAASKSSAAVPMKFKLRTDMKVCVAFDLMRVKVRDIAKMQYFTPALLKLFEVDEQTSEDGGEKPTKATKKNKSKRRN